MEHKRIMPVLILVMAAACGILAVVLYSVSSGVNRIPESALEDIVTCLAADGIQVDRELIPDRREMGKVYMCNSPDYSQTVASRLSGSTVRSSFAVPDGDVLIMTNGARAEFGKDFSFRYFRSGVSSSSPAIFELTGMADQISETRREEIRKNVVEFLEKGSREFEDLKSEIFLDSVWENEGKYYAICSRSIDGIQIAGNMVLCTVEAGVVTEASGTWCFLTPTETYSAQLSDLVNILFNVKKDLFDIRRQQENPPETVAVTAIERCYSLYFYGEDDSFCLIPCWQIVTDTAGKMIYNAIDSTLYTVK